MDSKGRRHDQHQKMCNPRSRPAAPCLEEQPLLSPAQAGEMMAVFKVLANDTCLRLLHALVRARGFCLTGLTEALAMKPQAVSNQLQRLLAGKILGSRRQGINIYYRIVNPCGTDLLDRGLCLVQEGCLIE